jgi:hypothetical protein
LLDRSFDACMLFQGFDKCIAEKGIHQNTSS